MRKIIILMVVFSFNSFALDYESKTVCKNGVCEKKEIFNGLKGPELKIEDIKIDQCLVDVKKNKFFRVYDSDARSKKIVLISELRDEAVTVVLSRETVYTDSKNFNSQMKIISCSSVDGQILNDEEKYSKCIKDNGRYSMKLFCAKERKKNF